MSEADLNIPKEKLPDSRIKNSRPTFCGPRGIMAKVFCVNCGKSGGMITDEWAATVFYMCKPCSEKWGSIPLPEIDEDVVKGLKNTAPVL